VRDVADRFEGLGLPARMDALLAVIDAASQNDPKKNYDGAKMKAARDAGLHRDAPEPGARGPGVSRPWTRARDRCMCRVVSGAMMQTDMIGAIREPHASRRFFESQSPNQPPTNAHVACIAAVTVGSAHS
jgi:hypothetical protein